MQVLKLDYLVDSLILLLHDNKPEYQNLIQKVIAIFETEKPGVVTVTDKDNDVGKLYIYLIKEVMELGITVEDKKDIDAFILKFKSNPLLTKDPELFTTLKGIFTDLEPLEEDRKTRIIQRLSNEILINSSGELMKRAFGRLANVADDLNKQQAVLKDITDICAEVVKMNEDGVALTTTEDENIARTANFANKEELTKALKVYNTTTVVNRFKTGLQAMNRALNGGFAQGSSIVFAALAYSGKAARNGTLVLTPHGRVPIETLKVGDEVMAWDGTVTFVTGVFPQGVRPIYRVDFPDGRHVEVDREHLWTVTTSKNATVPNDGARFLEDDTWQVYTTGEILEGMRSGIDYFIPAYLGCDKVTGADKLRIAGIMRSGEDAATCIAVDHPDELFVVEDDIVTHNTAVSIAASCYYGKVVLIVLGFLIDQWFKSIRQFTNVKRDDIYVIKGFEALKDLWEMIQNGFKPKIVICSTRTLSLYAVDRKEPYDSLPTYHELLEALGVGTIIMDEVHLNFYANTQIDLLSNVEHNIYLSATYLRSDPQGKKIFNLVFPKELVFGGSEVVKYTKVIIISYDLGIPDHAIARFKVIKGYLHAKYESFLLRNKRYFERFIDEILRRTIDQYFIPVRSSEQKLLILCQTKSFVLQVVESLKKLYPKLAPVPYFSGDSTYGKARMLEHKIIVSTIKSSSTGLDIKNLKVCINTVSFASEPQAAQCMGRLRRIPNEDTFFIDYYNREVSSQCWHIQNRKKAYRDRALSIDETSYN